MHTVNSLHLHSSTHINLTIVFRAFKCAYVHIRTREIVFALKNAFVRKIFGVFPHHDGVWMIIEKGEHHTYHMMTA